MSVKAYIIKLNPSRHVMSVDEFQTVDAGQAAFKDTLARDGTAIFILAPSLAEVLKDYSPGSFIPLGFDEAF